MVSCQDFPGKQPIHQILILFVWPIEIDGLPIKDGDFP